MESKEKNEQKRRRLFTLRVKNSGLPPGSLVFSGEKKVEEVRISVIDYDDEVFVEEELDSIEKAFRLKDSPTISWINIEGLHDVDIIQKIGTHFKLHPLAQEDILNIDQRPKMEEFEDHIVITLKMISYNKSNNEIAKEHVSLIVGERYVISFQERAGDVFELIRNRLRARKGRIRSLGSDYLAYSLIDAIVDHYFLVLENLGEEIEVLEDDVLTNPTTETVQQLHRMKRRLLYLRKSIWPLRDLIDNLERDESELIQKTTLPYLRDVYDHTIQIIDFLETMRDVNSGLYDMYLSSISNRMNEVMKVLTIIATIFIPLTFIAGIYGMNFEYMPELSWRGAYFFVWGVMAVIFIGMIFYFKRKKWL
jgi:magnesium transporter